MRLNGSVQREIHPTWTVTT